MTHVPRHCANLNAPCIKKGKIIICKAHVFFPFSKPASPYCLFSPFWKSGLHEDELEIFMKTQSDCERLRQFT